MGRPLFVDYVLSITTYFTVVITYAIVVLSCRKDMIQKEGIKLSINIKFRVH